MLGDLPSVCPSHLLFTYHRLSPGWWQEVVEWPEKLGWFISSRNQTPRWDWPCKMNTGGKYCEGKWEGSADLCEKGGQEGR